MALYIDPCFWVCGGFRNRLHSIGVRLIDTNPETRIATPIVTANSWSSRPTRPPMNRTGMKTATSESVIDRIVKLISRDQIGRASCRERGSSAEGDGPV